MKKEFKSYILLYFLLLSNLLLALSYTGNKKDSIINNFIKAYNQHNYSAARKDIFLLGKIILTKKRLNEVLGELNDMWGKLTIIAITYPTDSKAEVEVSSERDTTEKETISFVFNSKNKITGFFVKNIDFIYSPPKDSSPPYKKAAKIDSLLHVKFQNGNFNGCVLAIDSGRVIFKNCFGYSNFETKTYLNDSSVFELASCSKQFTAMAIMILAEKGKLKYSDTLQKYLPDLPYKNITIENLLTHTSGLPDYMDVMEKYWDKKKIATNYDIIKVFKQYKPKLYFKPKKRFDYSNTGYALLSIIIEKASGLTYAEFLKANIFEPLGMINTRIYNTRRSQNEVINNYAYGYVYSDSLKKFVIPDSLPNYKFVYWLDAITGDGSVNTTISDLVLWDKGLKENCLISKAALDKSYSSYKLEDGTNTDYGYGMVVIDKEGAEKIVEHSGDWPGYHTFILRFIETDKAIVILSNNEYPSFNQMADKIARILLNIKSE